MSYAKLSSPNAIKSHFFQLLQHYGKEHCKKSKNQIAVFYSIWEYDSIRNVAVLFLESKIYGFVCVEIDTANMFKIVTVQYPVGNYRVDLAIETYASLMGARKRLHDKFLGRKGMGKKKGFHMKHRCGPQASKRILEALKAGEISVFYEKEMRRLDIGMTYTP